MNLKAVYRQSIISLKANKIRSLLSVLGIVIGVMAVVIILSAGQGLKGLVTNQVESFGTNILQIGIKIPGVSQLGTFSSIAQGTTVTSLKPSDAEALRNKERFPYIENVSSLMTGQDWATYRNREEKSMILATDNEYMDIDQMAEVKMGRFFTRDESITVSRKVVLGHGVAQELFGRTCSVMAEEDQWCGENPIGKKIKMNNQSLEVIGVMVERGSRAGFDYDDIIYLPIETAHKLILGIDYLVEIDVRVKNESYFPQAKAEIESLMRRRHDITDPDKDDFSVMTMGEALETINEISLILDLLLGFLAAISLIVGGVGIMNIMLVSVAERTKEIGLRKAVGATKKNVLLQFLIESLVITGLGGLTGVIGGMIITVLSSLAIKTQLTDWPIAISWLSIVLAFMVSASIGLVFGVYPARQAAELDPIEALRKD